jgi:hypothetical protein
MLKEQLIKLLEDSKPEHNSNEYWLKVYLIDCLEAYINKNDKG